MQNLWSLFKVNWAKHVCVNADCRVETESPISPDPSLFCTGSWLSWVQCAIIDGKTSVALYCLLCIVLQHSNIIFCFLNFFLSFLQRRGQTKTFGGKVFPFPPLSLPFPPLLLSFPIPLFPFPSHPLFRSRLGPLNQARESGERCEFGAFDP